MPRKDGTGPAGQGPKTGRGMGNCQPNTNSTPQRPMDGRGRGMGRRNRGR